jgi:hypothetical protein
MKRREVVAYRTAAVDRVTTFLGGADPGRVFTAEMLKDNLGITSVPRDPRLNPYTTKAYFVDGPRWGFIPHWGNLQATAAIKSRKLG